MTTTTLQFRIYRYNPDKDAAPYMQDIAIEADETDRKLLDALVKKSERRYLIVPSFLPRRCLWLGCDEHQR